MLKIESQHLTWVGPIGMLLAVFSFLKKKWKTIKQKSMQIKSFFSGQFKNYSAIETFFKKYYLDFSKNRFIEMSFVVTHWPYI